jgi:hypothetical protein
MVCGPVCWAGKNNAFLETLETRFLATTWVSGVLRYAPRACPVKYYGLECWGWAVVGSNSQKNIRLWSAPPSTDCFNKQADSF